MSWKAQAWAADEYCPRSSDKLILIGLSVCHNDDSGLAYPSVAWLVKFSSLDRKTVLLALERLQEAGLIRDTGERKGNGVKCFRLLYDADDHDRDLFGHKEPIPKTGQVPKKGTDPKIPSNLSQKRDRNPSQKRDTEPVREPVKKPSPYSPPDGIDPERWSDFLEARKVAMTDGAYKLICNKVTKAKDQGYEPTSLFDRAIESGYRTIFIPDGPNRDDGNDGFGNALNDAGGR